LQCKPEYGNRIIRWNPTSQMGGLACNGPFPHRVQAHYSTKWKKYKGQVLRSGS
jgi:hypothetical protein